MDNVAYLSNDSRFTSFKCKGETIRFKTSPSLECYTDIKEWDNGYIVVNAVYNGVETEEYIDLCPILQDLCIDPDEFLHGVERVKIV